MQQHHTKRHEDVVQELNEVKAKLIVSERDRNRVVQELKRATQAEDHNKKAMEDLALALKEVAAESNTAKENLLSTEQQLDAVKEEATYLKKMVKSTEDTYEAVFKEQKKENDRLINIVNRLRVEAEESQLAWSCKELEFVKCIKKSEDDKNVVEAENSKLIQCLMEAQETSDRYKEESSKLRDILKQAINEANVAKEAASLARTENSFLKDSLAFNQTGPLTIIDSEPNLNTKDQHKADNIDSEPNLSIKDQHKADIIHTLDNSVYDSPSSYYPRTLSANFGDMDIERSSRGKKKALLRRFGELLRGGKISHQSPPKDIGAQKGIVA
ncbi:hypothetical protein RND81_13G218700 [Saponaria officinalis]|uniref:WEB family protein n=1 Tax=Saponaria officinalis TaxID=3572 RepID=A0AAW1H0T1_SAPOF